MLFLSFVSNVFYCMSYYEAEAPIGETACVWSVGQNTGKLPLLLKNRKNNETSSRTTE